MSNRRSALVPALMEGVGVFLVAVLGANVMFAPELQGAGLAATLVPALGFALAIALYRTLNAANGVESGCFHDDPRGLAPITDLADRRGEPSAPGTRRAA